MTSCASRLQRSALVRWFAELFGQALIDRSRITLLDHNNGGHHHEDQDESIMEEEGEEDVNMVEN